MSSRRVRAAGLLLVAAFVAGACTDSAGPAPITAPNDALTSAAPAPAQTGDGPGIDAAFSRLAKQMPGFGGMYYDRAGTLHVYMASAAGNRATLRSADVASRLGALGGTVVQQRLKAAASGGIVVDQAAYNFGQLESWKSRLHGIFKVPGVVYVDNDESVNRVRIAITPSASQTLVQQAVARAGVPAGAVVISRMSRITPLATLQDRLRPVPGGAQIVFEAPSIAPGEFFVCTAGFNAMVPSHPGDQFFVTASHCSDVQGGNTLTRYYQPEPEFGGNPQVNRIAVEFFDPQYGNPGGLCVYTGARCRLSDALLARYNSPSLSDFGKIARTTFALQRIGSLTIDPAHPRWNIIDQIPFPFLGDIANKVGRTSGWTAGPVVATCVDVGENGTDIVELCQDIVEAGARGGDSGSGVFERVDNTSSNVVLAGTLWGSGTLDGAPVFVFSAMENIEFELGTLITSGGGDFLATR